MCAKFGALGQQVTIIAISHPTSSRDFDPRPPHYRSGGTGMDDRLRAVMPCRYLTSHPSQLSLLLSVGREKSTGQSAKMRSGWE